MALLNSNSLHLIGDVYGIHPTLPLLLPATKQGGVVLTTVMISLRAWSMSILSAA
jgi:hypothetical protein